MLGLLIIHFGTASDIGGTDERVFQIANQLSEQGVEVTLSAEKVLRPEKLIHPNLRIIESTKTKLSFYSNIKWLVTLISGALRKRYDIIQIESSSFKRTFALLVLFHPFGQKSVIVFHDNFFEKDPRASIMGRLNLLIQKLLLTICDASITPGLGVKKRFEELQGELARRKMVVIPNGSLNFSITNDVGKSNRSDYGISTDAFVALFFGSMTFKPNFDAAMHLHKISSNVSNGFEKKTGRKLTFVVAGIGSKALPCTESYIRLGFVKYFSELLSLPDVIVLPHASSFSGPHVKTMYAFLSQKPVVATEDAVKDMPGLSPGKQFLQFDLEQPNSLLSCLIEVYSNKEESKHLALNAYAYTKMYSWKQIAFMHRRLYELLL
jgi:glycosyltransferase involved in cell wall biosynthesis